MRSIWRSVLTWLLVLAMPVQGIAAIGTQHCAPTHRGIDLPAKAEQAQPRHAHGHARAEAVLAAVNESPVLGPDHSMNAEHAISTAYSNCSACAACCLALGLPSGALDLPAWAEGSSLAPPTMTGMPSFVAGGLDRPPRNFLA
ncbi:MAG: hypothetical protein MUF16_25660 [Burkholderiaceae bacterium]|jgi:hypothetical protein|nr:hypothetical protein [Burkholderiaceae bacterium]